MARQVTAAKRERRSRVRRLIAEYATSSRSDRDHLRTRAGIGDRARSHGHAAPSPPPHVDQHAAAGGDSLVAAPSNMKPNTPSPVIGYVSSRVMVSPDSAMRSGIDLL